MAISTENWVCPMCGNRVDIAPLGLYAEVQCPACLHTEIVHAQLGNFLLEGVLGIGGMSVVYRAMDVVLNRPLAIKVLNDTFRDQPERIERFENESAMMARVRHNNVTSVYSAGRAFGQFYIAMELVEGTNLEHMVSAEQPLDALYALDIIRSVAQGLQAAHKAGLLHRDMKPGNILITPEGEAKVIDFGLAVDSQEGDTEEIIWATPYYVPPETLERQPEDVRTDIYALGMTLRYLLTGVESFEGPTDSLSALVACKRKQPSFAKQCPYAPTALCELVDHMTAFAPADRPKDYAQLIEEIDEVHVEVEKQTLLNINPIEDKRSRLHMALWALAGSFALGILIAAYIHPSKVTIRQKSVEIDSTTVPQDERDKLVEAMKILESKNYSAAGAKLLELSRQTSEACMGAWSAQLAKLVYYASGESNSFQAQEAQSLLQRHWGNNDAVSAAGMKFFAHMRTLIDPRRYPTAEEWLYGDGEWKSCQAADLSKQEKLLQSSRAPDLIRFIGWSILAEQAAWLGDEATRARCLEQSKIAANSLTIYKPLADLLLPAIEKERQSPADLSPLIAAERLMRQHHFTAAQQRFNELAANSSLTPAERERSRVFSEVCQVAAELVEMLNRRYPGKYRSNMSADEMANLIDDSPIKLRAVSDGNEGDNTPDKAIDNDLSTRWCAANSASGHKLDLLPDKPTRLSYVEVAWENAATQKVTVVFLHAKTAATQVITKNTNTSIISAPVDEVIGIRFAFFDVTQNKWGSIREVTVHTMDAMLKQEALVLGLLADGKEDAAASVFRQLAERNRPSAPFDVLAADWFKRLEKNPAPKRAPAAK